MQPFAWPPTSKKLQKRANALKNITIPRYETLTRDIQNALEEKEREEFTRLKVIKRMKQNAASADSCG
jgi:ATP synthase subunit D